MSNLYCITVVLDDRLVTLNAAVGLLRRRNLPVRSVTFGPHVTEGRSRLLAMIEADEGAAQRVAMLFEKLIGVDEARAVPAAIGVHLARPGEPVWAISGDGGFQMNMQEMATMVQEGLPIKLAIFNNGYLGMVRQWQQFFHGRRYSATPIWSPDYVKLADAYGIAGYRVETGAQIAGAIEAALRDPGPALIEFVIEQEANVYPMIPPGASLSEVIETAPAEPASA